MSSENLKLIEESLRGVAEVTPGSRGLLLHRLHSKYAIYHDVDPLTQKVADQASGARLALMTSATRIEFLYSATLDQTLDGTYMAPPSVVTLTCGEQVISVAHSNGARRIWDGESMVRIDKGEVSVAVFELVASAEPRLVEIWLPHNCNIELLSITADAPLEAASITEPRWVHYGSSISHSIEADEPVGVWPVVAARKLGLDLFSLGIAGSANVEQFAARAIAEQPADLISLKIGINSVNGRNMTRRTFVPAVHSFLDTIRAAQPDTRIVLISPIYCETHETSPGPTLGGLDGRLKASPESTEGWVGDLTLSMIRELLKSIVDRREDSRLEYLDGLELFSVAEASLMPDGLHPNAEGYRLIGERFATIAKARGYLSR